MNSPVAEATSVAATLLHCLSTVFSLIKDNIHDVDEKRKAFDEIAERLITYSETIFSTHKKFYDELPVTLKADHVQKYAENCKPE